MDEPSTKLMAREIETIAHLIGFTHHQAMPSRHQYPFEILVELVASHDRQSPDGPPEGRIEARIERSLDLAHQARVDGRQVCLDKQDFRWLCNARHIEPISSAASSLQVAGVRVIRARHNAGSHITGQVNGGRVYFPIIEDPTETPDFVQHEATDAEKRELLEKFQSIVIEAELEEARRHTLQ